MRFSDEQWKSTTLGASCDGFDYGIGAEAIDFDGSNQYIRITDIDDEYSLYTSRHPVSPSFIDENCICKENDILFARTGASTGKTYLYNQSDGKLYFAGFLIRVNVKQSYDSYFIFTITKTNKYNNWVKIMSARSGQPGINAQEYKKLSFKHPSIETQRKISSFIKKIDTRILLQSKIIKDLKTYKKTIINYILKIFEFEELSLNKLISKKYIRIIKPSELGYFEGTRKYLSTSSINEDGITSIEAFITYDHRPSRASMKPIKGSVWFAKMKSSIKVYLSENFDENEYVLSTGFYGVLCNENFISKYWLKELFCSDYFNSQKDRFSEGSSMSSIKDNQLSDILIKRFINHGDEAQSLDLLLSINKKIAIEIKLLEKYKEQKKFLLSSMFI